MDALLRQERDALIRRTLAELAKNGATYPDALPFGFVFTEGGQFQLQGETVTQLTYSDGLTVVSVFETAPSEPGIPPRTKNTSPPMVSPP